MMEVKTIEYLSDEYRASLELRNRILREPIGLKFTEQDLINEKDVFHIACFLPKQNKLVGACFLTPHTDITMQLRQMAVDSNYQKIGIGREIILFVEIFAEKKGYKYMYLHARKEAVAFYEKLGYEKESGEFMEVGIPHYEMLKNIE